MNDTQISWTQLTWNPMSGCKEISPECAYCYATTLAEDKRGTAAFPNGFDLTIRPHKLKEPSKVKAPSLIFCNSMSDPGLAEIPDDYRDKIFDAIEETPRHRYQMLTKRPEVLLEWFRRTGRHVPASVWMGVTIGSPHKSSMARLAALHQFRDLGARVLFVSAEPLLGDLPLKLDGIDWIVTGGESGRHWSDPKVLRDRFLVDRGADQRWQPREDRADWVRRLRDEADRAGCAHWFKQWGGPRPTSGGRILDGRTHDGMPEHVSGAMPAGYVHEIPVHASDARRQLPLLA